MENNNKTRSKPPTCHRVILLLVVAEGVLEGQIAGGDAEVGHERHRPGIEVRVEAVLVRQAARAAAGPRCRRRRRRLHQQYRATIAIAEGVELGQVEEAVGHVVLLARIEAGQVEKGTGKIIIITGPGFQLKRSTILPFLS